MKHMIRKPMLPLLLLAVMVFGTAFLAFFRADIAAGWEQIDRLYTDARVTVDLVPDAGWDNLQMKTHKSTRIEAMPEIAETLSVIECYYVMRDGTPLPEPADEWNEYVTADTRTIHGTNNLAWLTEYWDLTVSWHKDWSTESFQVTDGTLPCLVQQEFLDEYGLATGDVIEISPSPHGNSVSRNAPAISITIAGIYDNEAGRPGGLDLLVPEESFLGEPKLLFNSDMMYRCYYRAYALKLNPEYNREYDRIEDALEEILYDLDGYSFVTNARSLETAARPLTQKLQMQEMLVLPLCLLLCASAMVLAVLLGLGMETEVFLRLMWGERRMAVFGCLGGAVCLWLMICVAASCGASTLTAGTQWTTWALRYSTATAVLCLIGCAVPLFKSCRSNLVKSYQSREGE